ncbi:hypothetical protein FIBSPDRAFT_851498 [Athelia psychrophila]|uniref:Uncharacterized protein n=1 Tax=Athelia psychrophila TaxID=1759441 RepID=A0A166SIU3_9AGAM|nr:hypothetical protein FIBSPDRAFT_851498 [Fibularhizoctonia sp. CBS 109695]
MSTRRIVGGRCVPLGGSSLGNGDDGDGGDEDEEHTEDAEDAGARSTGGDTGGMLTAMPASAMRVGTSTCVSAGAMVLSRPQSCGAKR